MESRRNNRRIRMAGLYRVMSMLILSFGLSACATSGPVLIGALRYERPQGMGSVRPGLSVAVGVFNDQRGVAPSLIGKRILPSAGVENELVVGGSAADMVSSVMKQALSARGIEVKEALQWDLSLENIPDIADLFIWGEVKAMDVYAESRPLSVSYKADVQIRLMAADAKQKKLIRTLNLNSRLERQDIVFSFSTVEDMLTEALSSAIDQVFADQEINKRLQ